MATATFKAGRLEPYREQENAVGEKSVNGLTPQTNPPILETRAANPVVWWESTVELQHIAAYFRSDRSAQGQQVACAL